MPSITLETTLETVPPAKHFLSNHPCIIASPTNHSSEVADLHLFLAMTSAEEIIRRVIAPYYQNVFFVRDCIPETSAFQNGRAADDVDADLYSVAYNALVHNVPDMHSILDSVVVVEATHRFQCQVCDELSRALQPLHTTPSVIGLKNVPVVFNQYLSIDQNERDLPPGVETIASLICPSMTVPAVAFLLCSSLYITNLVVQGDPPVDLDPDPSRVDGGEEEFPPLDDYSLLMDDDPDFFEEFLALEDGDVDGNRFVFPPPDDDDDDDNDIHYVFPPPDGFEFPPLDRAGNDDQGAYKTFLAG